MISSFMSKLVVLSLIVGYFTALGDYDDLGGDLDPDAAFSLFSAVVLRLFIYTS